MVYGAKDESHIVGTVFNGFNYSYNHVPDGRGLVLWAWGAGAALVVGPWMWSLNEITKKSTGKSLWG